VRKWIENSPISIGIALIVVGLTVIFLAWNGAADKDFVEGQLPYLISGGIGGLAIVASGLTVILVQTRRRDNAELVGRLDEMLELLRGGVGSTMRGPTAVPDDSMVIAGRSTYHSPGCHIIEGRDEFQAMSLDAAVERGLTPCRICRPSTAATA
jgi:hypothetical protein